MANPRKFSEKIALHHQKQAEETAAFEQIMREVSDATQRPEELPLSNQYAMAGGRSGGTSPSRSPAGQRGRASSSVGPMRRPADRRHDTSPYGSTVYLSPPPDSNWRRTNSDSALHQSCGVEQQTTAQPLSPHRTMHSHAHPHLHPHQNHHRRGDIHLDVLAPMNPANRPRSSCEIPRIPNNNNVYAGGEGGGGLGGEMAVPGGSLPDLTSVHFPPPHYAPHSQHAPHAHPAHRASPDYQPRYSPTSPGAVSPGGGSVSPATGGLSPASGSPVGATVPLHQQHHDTLPQMYDAQNHLSVPNTNNYLHHNKNMSPLDHGWIPSGYQTHCSPPSQYSSTSNINIPSPTMVHSPGSPVESPQTDYNNLHQALLQPFEQITMLDNPVSSYNTTYLNHGSPHSPQTTNSSLSYPQSTATSCGSGSGSMGCARHNARDPVAGGGGFAALQPLASPSAPPTPATPASIPDIVLTDYSGELDAGMFGGEEAQLRAGLDLDDLNLLDDPTALVPDSAVEHEFRLDRL
ncbi:CREB-regulated transcription coactivator 3-like isoform X2 [Helicoverpa zea]|uniref:CREB-regulated transcription coactivator 3-like isoform X2 n=1 Tax=Helicoverpa zea TaxID=7113 RepID=UPI001F5AA77C|nr:CREB-regulated transcription coactivator 3-like isoform X2 [Helicoverpa zea]